MCVSDLHEFGVAHLRKKSRAELRSPDIGKCLAVTIARREREVVLDDTRIDMSEEFIEDVIAGAGCRHARDVLAESVFRKLLRERECPVRDALLDALQLQARASQVRLGRRALQRRAIAHALEFKIELNPIGAERADAAVYRLSTHR